MPAKVYLEIEAATKKICPVNTAYDGFNEMGYEIEWFSYKDIESLGLTIDTMVVGYIRSFLRAMDILSVTRPLNVDIPDELLPFTYRKVWETTIGEIRNTRNVFVKPLHDHKAFAGRLVRRLIDLYGTIEFPEDFPVLASSPVKFRSEYRCFVWKGTLEDIRRYKGDFSYPSIEEVQKMIQAWRASPVAYCLDVGVLDSGETALVEVNDGYSMGPYGIDPRLYARMVEARWCELTGAVPVP